MLLHKLDGKFLGARSGFSFGRGKISPRGELSNI